jgi:hypothetical protein
MSQGVPQQFQAGSGTVAGAIQNLQQAGLAPSQQYFTQAGAALGQAGGQYAGGPGYTAAGFDPSSTSSYMNPYEEAAVQQALSDIRRQGDIAQNQLSAQAVGAGAFGGRPVTRTLWPRPRRPLPINSAVNRRKPSSGLSPGNKLLNKPDSVNWPWARASGLLAPSRRGRGRNMPRHWEASGPPWAALVKRKRRKRLDLAWASVH